MLQLLNVTCHYKMTSLDDIGVYIVAQKNQTKIANEPEIAT